MAEILVVDDEIGIRELLSEILGDEGHTVHLAESAAQARVLCQSSHPDLVLLDIWMPDTDGVTLLKEWASRGQLTMPVIMMSGHATIDTAVEATRIGAADFLEKPITLQKLLRAVEAGLIKRKPVMSAPQMGQNSPSIASLGAATAQGGATGNQSSGKITTTFLPVKGSLDAGSPELSGNRGATSLGNSSNASFGSFGGAYPSYSAITGEDSARMASQAAVSNVAEFPGLHSRSLNASQVAISRIDLNSPLRDARDEFERAYFQHHLFQEEGSMTRVAEKTGLERTHLYRKLKQLGIDLNRSTYRKNLG